MEPTDQLINTIIVNNTMGYHGDFSQGWILTGLSSVLCVLGCFIIFSDDVYYLLFPRWITSRFPFHLKENYAFMNGSLSFSSGCLLLTALYRLLPEAMRHLKASKKSSNENMVLVFSFIAGILICVLFNEALHYFTSESVVHCSHDGEDKPAQAPYSDLERGDTKNYGSAHTHGAEEAHHDHDHHGHDGHEEHEEHEEHDGHEEHEVHVDFHDTEDGITPDSHPQPPMAASEDAPLLGRRKSSRLLHYFSLAKEDPQFLGECKGYSSAEVCLHRGHELHFCEIPELESPDKAAEDESDSSNTVNDITAAGTLDIPKQSHGHHHLHPIARSHSHSGSFSQLRPVHSHGKLDDHSHHMTKEHHHHHVNSPLSRLLLIGIQTILAITLHKFPEGFITYITSETNPELGVLIFLSLLIHNYTEGFSMCLPLYYSFPAATRWRKLKAASVSALLGGFSQPLGALGGFLFMRYYAGDSIDIGTLNRVFGISMAVTSGFLVVIALSMYGSAVSFSGLPNFVMLWCLVGMSTIGLLTVLISTK